LITVLPKFTVEQDGTTIQVYHADSNQGLPRHDHVYSHLVFCHAGKILITKENVRHEMDKNSRPVNLLAGQWHEIEALEAGTVFVNIFSTPVPIDFVNRLVS
jgi:quercetin dioxygenase-like cupin family protein